MKVTLIVPHIGRKHSNAYVRTWQMEPLPIATLAGLTPQEVELDLYDERLESIDFDRPTDLVGVNIEAYTAKRGYEICAEYRRRGVPTIVGGYHAMLMPEEAVRYADGVVAGFAEGVWESVLEDAAAHRLKARYNAPMIKSSMYRLPDRSVFGGRKYLPLSCVETGRGCPFACNFCSITVAAKAHFVPRPIDLVVADIASLRTKTVFFVDDNIVGSVKHAKQLLRELIPLNIRWISQASLNIARDEELLSLMAQSGCLGILVGFESLQSNTLRAMGKDFMANMHDMDACIRRIHAHGLGIYATFMFGYDTDTVEDFERTVEYTIERGMFIGAFNHLVPFPGTPLYARLKTEGRLISDAWWLDPEFRFNDVPFHPAHVTREQVREVCIRARKRFYSIPSILRRARNVRGNLNSFAKIGAYLTLNALLRKEIEEKDGLPLGNELARPVPKEDT